ncbi:hypothetical protein F4083_11750 [Candidatus Poribacteria bacterium]|nr:hypothetical protein [Candidatus Poribacteria bacterium]MYF57319.1 hypothetical protein [Candidatus Poribacteria bacterium]MYI94970.1 hypothetical protein [Candidatus Poribacteria bacterium]
MRRLVSFTLRLFFVLLFVVPTYAQLPDFQVDATSITFSNPNPVEGEEITIWVEVKNVGEATPTMNEDLRVDLYEGERGTKPLQVLVNDIILDLKVGETDRVSIQWQPPAGKTEIYAYVNPSGEKHIQESDNTNNVTHAVITATPITFPQVTPEEIQEAIDRGVTWIESRQGKSSRTCLQCGVENQIILTCFNCNASLKGLAENFVPGSKWNFGEDPLQETALALQALLASGRTTTDYSVQKGVTFLLEQDWNTLDVYQYAVLIPVLVAIRNPEYKSNAQFAVNQLVKKQLPVKGNEFADPRDDGGWGYGLSADGAHMNMVIYALYAAKQWGLEIPEQTWERAEKWIRRNQTDTGGWLYNLVDNGSPWAIGVYGSMTATGLWALRACGVSTEDVQIQDGVDWLERHWSLTRNPGCNSWLYYYLLSLQRFCDIPPKVKTLAGRDWYDEICRMMVARQHPDGRWHGAESDFLATCFAVMTLSRALVGPTEPNIAVIPQTLRFSPPSPRVGEAVRLSATLTNNGTPIDETLKVKFFADDEEIETAEVFWTSALNETVVTVDWVPKQEGDTTVSVQVDFNDSDSSDNSDSTTLTVHPKSTSPTDTALVKPKEISEGVYQVGNVVLDTNKKEVVIPGEINIATGDTTIEFFACGLLGPSHESILMLNTEPLSIFVALGLLELKPGMNLEAQGDPRDPEGSNVQVWVEWKQGDKVVSKTARELVWNKFTKQPMEKTHWVFTGGRIRTNQLTSQLTHNIIAVHRDPDSILNNPLPGGIDDRTYRVNTDVVPPKGTKVKVIIRPI